MISKTNMAILTVSAVIGVATFSWARAPRGDAATPPSRPIDDDRPRWGRAEAMARWLGLSDEKLDAIAKVDPTYWQDMIRQHGKLTVHRERLATLLEDPASTDQQILDHVEQMIAVGNDMERRVVKRLLKLRAHLTAEQQKKLFDLCALGVRARMAGRGRGAGWGRGQGEGGFGAGRGQGRGWDQDRSGRRWERDQGGRGLGRGQGRGRGAGQGEGRDQ